MQSITPNIFTQENKIVARVDFLKPWEDNPRSIDQSDFEQLKKDLGAKQFKPILIMEDGTVLGGNMRIRAYKELGRELVWVSVISVKEDGELCTAYVNNEKDKTFNSRYDAMVHYSLKDNEVRGKYDKQLTAEQLSKVALPLDEYKVMFADAMSLDDLADEFGPSDNDPTVKEEKSRTCPHCGREI